MREWVARKWPSRRRFHWPPSPDEKVFVPRFMAVSSTGTHHHSPQQQTQHNTTQHNTTQHNTTQHNQHKTTQNNTKQHKTTQNSTTQHNTTRHNTTQHNTTKHTQHNTTQQSTTTQHNITTQHNQHHNTYLIAQRQVEYACRVNHRALQRLRPVGREWQLRDVLLTSAERLRGVLTRESTTP